MLMHEGYSFPRKIQSLSLFSSSFAFSFLPFFSPSTYFPQRSLHGAQASIPTPDRLEFSLSPPWYLTFLHTCPKPKTKVSEQEGEIRRVWVPRTHLVHHEKQWVGDGESPRLYRVNQPWLALKKLDGGLFEIFELFLNSFTRNKQEQQMPTRIKEVL